MKKQTVYKLLANELERQFEKSSCRNLEKNVKKTIRLYLPKVQKKRKNNRPEKSIL